MDGNEEFMLAVWRLVGAVVLGITLTLGSCTAYQSHEVRLAVKDGADPLAAYCAIRAGGEMAVCAVLAGRRP